MAASPSKELRRERIAASPRWDGERFRNTHATPRGNVPMPSLKEFLCGGERRVPLQPLPALNPLDTWTHPAQSGLRATWLGHSTVLLEIDGKRVLTDPVWGPRASPSRFIGPRRFQPVPVSMSELPPLDAVLLSHDHYDHLDFTTMRLLRRVNVPIVTSLGVGAHLEAMGIAAPRIVELDWWESHRLPGTDLEFTATPAQHFSGRGLKDGNQSLWSSWVVATQRHRAFFSGDTGLTPEYSDVRARFGAFHLVMLEVGAFHPAWSGIHLGPENALKAHALLGGGALLPIHWGTFNLALHPWDEPVETLLRLASADTKLLLPRLGQPVEPTHDLRIEQWWRGIDSRPAPPLKTDERPEQGLPKEMPWPID
ncbi:MAG TPA: MBL fold metallo-hydrolase [Steroidobacteraceae bacterium]|jgi:L-ascorbate metabolism protein UlaG (beta-lactamase superfamily)|nr:MBL fold metallo-hydrolase [Steroidobacteraceae bacterium]